MTGYVHAALACACTMVVVWLSDLHTGVELACLVVGGGIGLAAGRGAAHGLERRAEAVRVLDLYDEDVVAFVVAVAIVASAPFAFGSALAVVSASEALQNGLQGVVCSLAAFWCAHDVVLGHHLRRLQARFGPLRIRRFYARSTVGAQGLLGQRGVVTRTGPQTYVRVRGELWAAESADALAEGDEVLVVAMRGLTIEVVRHGR